MFHSKRKRKGKEKERKNRKMNPKPKPRHEMLKLIQLWAMELQLDQALLLLIFGGSQMLSTGRLLGEDGWAY